MTRNHSDVSLNTSCLRVPVNPYSQQPSPSYERSQAVTPNVEEESSLLRKLRPASASSRPASSMNSPISKGGGTSKRACKKTTPQGGTSSPFDSFLDFYESIPDYQDVTHLSDKEFSEKMRLLRDRQKQYLDNLGGRYTPLDYEESHRGDQNYEKKTCKSVNKLELAKEWVNKSCDSLSSLGRKSDEYRIRISEEDNRLKKASSESPRKYEQYNKKDETEGLLMDTGSSLSADSNIMKTKVLRSDYAIEEEPKPITSSNTIQDCDTPFTNSGRSESCQGLSSYYNLKDSHIRSYEFYNVRDGISESSPSPLKKKNQSYGLQSSGTSELNVQGCTSPIGLAHHDVLSYEDYYVPTSGWMQSDSDSMLGTMHHIPSTRPSTAMVSQSLPGSPITKRPSSSSKVGSPKKKTRRKRRSPSKSVTKPVPFSFMCNDRQYSRSTPDLSSHCRSPSPKNFRARPIPRNLFSNYVYQKRQEDEFFRALKRKVRAEELMRTASLPPSMEFRERLSRVQAEAAAAEAASLAAVSSSSEQSGGGGGGGAGNGSGGGGGSGSGREGVGRAARGGRGRRGRPRRPPDFSKCHEKMRQELHERQARNITTSPSPYSLRTSSLSPRRKCLQGSSSSGSDSRRCRPGSRSGLDVSTSRSNLAALLRIQSARQRLDEEHHRLREEQVRRAEMRLKERLRRLTPAWRSIQYSTEEDLALRAAARREEERERRREHGVLMRHMLHRVHTIPTLFERQSATLSRSPHSQSSPRRSACDVDQCGPNCPVMALLDRGLDDDEDAADVKMFVESQARRQSGPSRSRQRERPCSAGTGAASGAGQRAAHSASPDKRGRHQGRHEDRQRSPSTAAAAALRSPDRLSSKLRSYHRQLPHQHRVEFSDSPVHQDDEDEEDRDVVPAVGEVEAEGGGGGGGGGGGDR